MRAVKGFTLIELLVVLMIVGLLLSLVGPFALEQVDKARAQQEWLQFKREMQSSLFYSFLNKKKLYLHFQGAEITVDDHGDFKKYYDFDYLFFNDQTVVINENGLPDRKSVFFLKRKIKMQYDFPSENELESSE